MSEMESGISRFNVRVYFLLWNEKEEVLVSDEIIRKGHYTKFPGGGLELGEGIRDALKREAIEELGQEIEVLDHFYTTDFFIRSAYLQSDQVISIYYKARLTGPAAFRTSASRFDFQQSEVNEESFRWVHRSQLMAEDFAFPADRHVAELIFKS